MANTKLYYNHNNIPPGSPNPSYPGGVSPTPATGSTKLYKLNATTNRTGLEFVIKVMAGDKLDILGKSYYVNTTQVTNSNSTSLSINQIMTSLLLGPANPIGAKGATATDLTNLNSVEIPSTFIRGNNGEPATTVPKAYINYILLDDQFKFAGGGASRVGTSGVVKDHWTDGLQNINVTKSGYLFVYVSNESNFNVFFDNVEVVHTRGAILEETHYYPFGLIMSGLSSKALSFGTPENKLKYNGKEEQKAEFSDGSGLDWLDYGARMYDGQVGRWSVIDLLSEKYYPYSPFAYCINNTVNLIDFDGNEIGNPNSPDTKKIQEIMSKSSVSKILWEKMSDDKVQKIYFYIERPKSTSKFAKTMGTAGAESTTLSDYNYRSKNGKHNPNSEKVAFEFDQESGNNYKSNEWNNAAIVVNDENRISVVSKLTKAGISTEGYSVEETNEIVYLYLLTHEATHTTLQSTYNSRVVKKGPDGKYVQTTKVIPHDKREEEIDADKMAVAAALEYDTNRKKN